jgi:hypothetical protein
MAFPHQELAHLASGADHDVLRTHRHDTPPSDMAVYSQSPAWGTSARHGRPARPALLVYNHDVVVRRTSQGDPDYGDPDYCPLLWRSS